MFTAPSPYPPSRPLSPRTAVCYASARFIQHNFRALSIHVVPPTDSRIYHAVVVLDAGFRIYLQVGKTHHPTLHSS